MDDSPPDRPKPCVNERIDIRVGVERRRRWRREDKLRIVRESLAPNAVVTELARRQNWDGSWVNPVELVRENEPLVATANAVSALAKCKP